MLKHERTSVYDFNFHLVWVTKYRQPIFTTPERVTALKQILTAAADRNHIEIQTMEVLPDHVHLLVSFPPKMAASSAVKALKGGSARQWFIQFPATKQQLWGGHLWSPSFFMSTVGNISKDIVKQYIDAQLKHYNGGRPRVNSSQH